ncbi:MAG TPA: class I SAM-dependent methyltransferase [Candidatus Dormibacteraeota bacterium]
MSVSFDRAASYYDETRSLPAEAFDQILTALADRMRPAGAALEIGAGTGRYLVPLRRAGVRMVGVDLSRPMLARLREKDSTAPVVLGDATALPFSDGAFGSALAVHVLHLIPTWRQALAELARVVKRRGRLFVDAGGGDNPVEQRFFAEAGAKPEHPGLRRGDDLDHEMGLLGADREPKVEVPVTHELRVVDYIEQLEAGLYSRCWTMDAETLRRAGAATRDWAAEALGDIEAPIRVERTVTINVYRLG